jgi:hypothetical protein
MNIENEIAKLKIFERTAVGNFICNRRGSDYWSKCDLSYDPNNGTWKVTSANARSYVHYEVVTDGDVYRCCGQVGQANHEREIVGEAW